MDLPQHRAAGKDALEAQTPDQFIHRFGGVDKCTKSVGAQEVIGILEPDQDLREHVIARVHEAIEALRTLSREPNQALHVIEAADNPIQGHDIGHGHIVRQLHEIPVELLQAVAMTMEARLFAGSFEVRTRGVDAGDFDGSGSEKFMLDGANAAADVEKTAAKHLLRSQSVQEDPGCVGRSVASVPLEFGTRHFYVHVLFYCINLTAIHALLLRAAA